MPARLREGIDAAKRGDKITARRLLQQVLSIDGDNELALMWMASVVDTLNERRFYLERAPEHQPEQRPRPRSAAPAGRRRSRSPGARRRTARPATTFATCRRAAHNVYLIAAAVVAFVVIAVVVAAVVSSLQSPERHAPRAAERAGDFRRASLNSDQHADARRPRPPTATVLPGIRRHA